MSKTVYVTRRIPQPGLAKLAEGFEIVSHESDEAIAHDVLVQAMRDRRYDALLCMLTDQIDAEVLDAAGKMYLDLGLVSITIYM